MYRHSLLLAPIIRICIYPNCIIWMYWSFLVLVLSLVHSLDPSVSFVYIAPCDRGRRTPCLVKRYLISLLMPEEELFVLDGWMLGTVPGITSGMDPRTSDISYLVPGTRTSIIPGTALRTVNKPCNPYSEITHPLGRIPEGCVLSGTYTIHTAVTIPGIFSRYYSVPVPIFL